MAEFMSGRGDKSTKGAQGLLAARKVAAPADHTATQTKQQSRSGSAAANNSLSSELRCTGAGVTAGRDIWPQDMQQKLPRFCVGCRGEHQSEHEHNPQWQPYTPLQRFYNLNMLDTRFTLMFRRGDIPLVLVGGHQPVRWKGTTADGKALKPGTLSEQQYKQLLPIFFEGVREGHEPYRFVASYAGLQLLAEASSGAAKSTKGHSKQKQGPQQAQWLLDVLPEVASAIRQGLNTLQPSLAGNMMLVLQRLLDTNSSVGPALAKHYKQLLPAMFLLMKHSKRDRTGTSRRLILPPPHCLPPVASFTGDGPPPTGSPTCCAACGAAFTNTTATAIQIQQGAARLHQQEEVCGRPQPTPCQAPLFAGEIPEVHARSSGCTIRPRRTTLREVIEETLQMMVKAGGLPGLDAVQQYIPTFGYCDPQD